MRRTSASKRSSVRQFRNRASKTHRKNVAQPLRGGWRM